MPCNSDYMNPTQDEQNKVQTSKLICYVDKKLGIKTRKEVKEASKDCYGKGVELNIIVPELCAKLKGLTKQQKEEIVYNAKDKTSRELADWLEEHQKADRTRLKFEKEQKEKQKTREGALKKLTLAERKSLGIN